jgi:4-amino-4-deoxy-L-arabinose transferase-like glycosyltransferase
MAELARPLAPISHGLSRTAVGRRGIWNAVRAWPISRQILLIILVVYVAKQGLAVAIFPPFTGHDEVAHFAYIETVATEHRVPQIIDLNAYRAEWNATRRATGDYLPADLYPYCRYVLDWYCSTYPGSPWLANPPKTVILGSEYYPTGWQYAANHPPLYYLLMAPLYKAFEHESPAFQEHVIRVAAIPFGLIVVIFAFLLAELLFPGDLFMISTVTAFVAFQPQISYEAAMVNNDITAIAAFSVMLYLLARCLRYGVTWRLAALIGANLGIGLLFKSTMLVSIPLIAVAIVLGAGVNRWREWVAKGAFVAVLAGFFCWPWYLFLYRTYGNFSALPQVKALQYLWTYRGKTPPTIWSQLFSRDFAMMRWRETWGEFGWRLIHLHRVLLWIIGVPFIVALIGLFVFAARALIHHRDQAVAFGRGRDGSSSSRPIGTAARPATWQLEGAALMALAVAAAYYSILQFGLTFSLTQARYAFPCVNAFAILSMLGLRTLIPARFLRYGQALIVFCLLALNVVIFTQYVIPYWYLPS